MKEIVFFSAEKDNISETAKMLFTNLEKQDPASINYERILERPNINWLQVILQVIIPIIAFILSVKLLLKNGINFLCSMRIACFSLFFYILLHLKKILICLVHIYQHFAPDSIRMKCRFEPSCSQYMILALEKYGVFRGLKMGINRLNKCKIGNGGYDFP